MPHDRITELRVSGLRVIQDITLPMRGMTVLIGDNGSGKSSILEALELLRHAAKPIDHVPDIIVNGHGGLESLLRRGENQLRLGVTIEGAGPRLDYTMVFGNVGNSPAVLSERVDIHAKTGASKPLHALIRDGTKVRVFDVISTREQEKAVVEERTQGQYGLVLPWLGTRGALQATSRIEIEFQRIIDALGAIEVHAPFETRPLWQQHELGTQHGPRWPSMVEHAESLSRYALNLPNAFQELRNIGGETWSRVLDRVRLGLGADVRDFRLPPARRGEIELEVVLGTASDRPLPAALLSEGQISYLSFVALSELHPNRSVLAIDEPELHLHPTLLARVMWILEDVAKTSPVLLSTHSDRLLDSLSEPLHGVVLCELNEQRATSLRWPDTADLAEWLQEYRGIGSIRSEGYQAHVFKRNTRAP
jgi:predicted ATPase